MAVIDIITLAISIAIGYWTGDRIGDWIIKKWP